MKNIGCRSQRTIARPVEVEGVGFLTGATVRMRLRPAPPSAGVVFVRTDLKPPMQVPARVDRVSGTRRRTILGRSPTHVGLVEHILAALAGLRIDNCYVEVNASEPPGLDGSSQGFVDVLRQAGTELQPAQRAIWTVEKPLAVTCNGATLTLHPSDKEELKISYLLDYGPWSSIGRQCHTEVITPESFANNLADCRTYIFESEAAELRSQGLGARTTTADLLVFGDQGLINNKLRYANELARHKILDIVGDLSLFGCDLNGHLVAYRSGHSLNVELVRLLAREMNLGCRTCQYKAAA